MPRLLLCSLVVLLAAGPAVPTAVAAGGSAVLNVTAQVVAACSVVTAAPGGQARAAVDVVHRCSMEVPHRVSIDSRPPQAAHAGPTQGSVPPPLARAVPHDGPPSVTRERGRAGDLVIVTVTY